MKTSPLAQIQMTEKIDSMREALRDLNTKSDSVVMAGVENIMEQSYFRSGCIGIKVMVRNE